MLDPFSMASPDSEQPADDPADVPTEAQSPADAAGELAAAKKEAADNYDRYLRAVADLENSRRRAVREKEELRLFATAGVLGDLIPVLDSLALALDAARQPKADLKSLVSGVDHVLKQFKAALAAQGFVEINPVGLAFDPHQHEAIAHQPSPDVKEEHVMTVVRTGFSLNGRLLRPASVIVSSGPAARKG
jgi:molecular chaperone GrpE